MSNEVGNVCVCYISTVRNEGRKERAFL